MSAGTDAGFVAVRSTGCAQGASQHLDRGLAARCQSGMEAGSRPPVRPGTSGGETVLPAPVRSELISTGVLGSPVQMRGGPDDLTPLSGRGCGFAIDPCETRISGERDA